MVVFLFFSMTDTGQPVSRLYDLPQLHGMSYVQFLVCPLEVDDPTL